MKQALAALTLTTLSFAGSAPVLAADDAIGKDLKATIALQGFPCNEIATSKRNADSDYTATCKDGNRYRIFVSSQGRVVVQKL
ncbi:MAG: hypothetical protein ABI640_10180 [Gammaproteobacteria bacterium]